MYATITKTVEGESDTQRVNLAASSMPVPKAVTKILRESYVKSVTITLHDGSTWTYQED